jgi:hypothetical protein
MRSHRALLVLAGVSLTGVLGMNVGQPAGSQAPAPMACDNFPLEPTVLIVTPRGGRFELGWPGNFVRFPNGAIEDSASYRIARATAGSTVLAGITIDPIGDAPSRFLRPVQIRLNYARCQPRPAARSRKLLQSDGRGGPWMEVDSSGTVPGEPSAVGGHIEHLTSFAIAQ